MKTLDMTDEHGLEYTPKATAHMAIHKADNTATIVISDAYNIKDELKQRDYHFNGRNKTWESPQFDADDPRELYQHWANLRANVAVKPDQGGQLYKAEKVWGDKIAPMLNN